jgi:hypothetical protein
MRTESKIALLCAVPVVAFWISACGGAPGLEGETGEQDLACHGAGCDGGSDTPVDPAAAQSCAKWLGGAGAASKWVYADASGHIAYKPIDSRGDQIIDFSYAGYMGGGVAFPSVPATKTVKPSGGDDTAAIQGAIDAVSQLPVHNGSRGAVVLAPGTFTMNGSIHIRASGVVLRGSGSGAGGTEIHLTGNPHMFLEIQGSGSWVSQGSPAKITDAYVPVGARSFHVDNASAFKPGDALLMKRVVTDAWVSFMGMDKLVRNGKPQTWLNGGSNIETDRVVANVKGNEITLDAPLSDNLDSKYVSPPGVTITKVAFPGRITQVGLESLRVVAPASSTPIDEGQFQILTMHAVQDAWVKDVAAQDTTNSVSLDNTTKRITVEQFDYTRTTPANGSSGYPLELTINGTQILVHKGSMKGDNIYTWSTGGRATGPNVVLHATASGAHNRVEPHMRWATGLLVDNVSGGDQMNLYNRGTAGSGHGWAMGWGVLWNSTSGAIDVQQPPGSQNFAIGCKGREASSTAPGAYDSHGTSVAPSSLYLAQLCERLGASALANIGYH